MTTTLFDEIPGYREAVARENRVRSAAFLGYPITLCGVEVLPLTPRRMLFLEVANSPFVTSPGAKFSPSDVALFLWVASVEFKPGDAKAARRFTKRIARRVQFAAAIVEIEDYLDDAFQDAPGGGKANSVPPTSWAASLIDSTAREYGWAPDVVLDTPFAALWQLQRRMVLRADPKAVMFNRSDRVRSEWLRDINNAPK